MLVEIWSDIVCPWCAIGKARFEQALGAFPHADEVEVVWRSFELDPHAPLERGDLVAHLAEKYGTSVAQAQQMMDRMTATAADEGLTFRFDVARGGNTFDAHRLLHLAKERGRQHELGQRLFTAYLSDGRHIADRDELQAIAVEAGLDEVEAKEVLHGDRYADAVRQDELTAQRYGIRGVPFFVIDGRYGLSGAQPAPVLLQALEQAWSDAESDAAPDAAAAHDHAAGEACADGSCTV